MGATGSIGESTLKVIRKHPEKIKLLGISAHQQVEKLSSIAKEFNVPYACLTGEVSQEPSFPEGTELQTGEESLKAMASIDQADIVVVAVVGAVGLLPTLAALKAGKDVVLANKESLVVGGEMVMKAAQDSGARIIPADSEHNAVFQCIQGQANRTVESVILTASGGAFRDLPVNQLEKVSHEEALCHPNWSMGKKITVDSATMANKGLELIEARWLFDLKPSQLEVVIHPPQYCPCHDSVCGWMLPCPNDPALHDLRITKCNSFPERHLGVEPSLDFSKPLDLSFSPPSLERYPCLRLVLRNQWKMVNRPLWFSMQPMRSQ